jgi:hypothetical protein
MSDSIKIRLVGAELLHAHGRTDQHDEANRRFSQFCERALQKKREKFPNERTYGTRMRHCAEQTYQVRIYHKQFPSRNL